MNLKYSSLIKHKNYADEEDFLCIFFIIAFILNVHKVRYTMISFVFSHGLHFFSGKYVKIFSTLLHSCPIETPGTM